MDSKVAIVIPLYKQFTDLDLTEKISLEQTFKILVAHDICFVTHKEIDVNAYCYNQHHAVNVKTILFEKSYFANIAGYNRLLLGYEFYNSFREYKFILICQLDLFVFSCMLEHFIKLNYDYIGGTWFEGYNTALKTSIIIAPGNVQFSLRKTDSFLKVLNLFNFFCYRNLNFNGIKEALIQPVSFLRIFKHGLLVERRSYRPILPWQFPGYEDVFWSTYVKQFFSWFKVGSIEDSISFSFEVNPDILFNLNNQQLPMATHAWQKYNPSFWKPHIEKFGYSL